MAGLLHATLPKSSECATFLALLKTSNSMESQIAASYYFRKRMTAKHEPLGELADELTSELIDCLTRWGSQEVQLNAAWALTNMACHSMEDTHRIVRLGGVEELATLAKNSFGEPQDQAIWALGNIAADCASCRNRLRSPETFDCLVGFLSRPDFCAPRRRATLTWCIVNILRNGVSSISNLALLRVVKAMHASLSIYKDENLLCDAVWSIAFAIDGIEDNGRRIDVVLAEEGLAQKLVALLRHEKRSVCSGALRAVGNIITGTDLQTTAMLNFGVLTELQPLLKSEHSQTVRETLWVLGNIAAGPEEHVERIFILPYIGATLMNACRDESVRVRKEAYWLVVNALTNASEKLLDQMIGGGLIAVPEEILVKCPEDEALVQRTLGMLIHNTRRPGIGEFVRMTLRFTEIASALRAIQDHPANDSETLRDHAEFLLNLIAPNGGIQTNGSVKTKPEIIEIDRRLFDDMECE
ncbi:Armadillo/beta-catenin-like repeat family protein [Aphelenchoides avenae]|nr:Armadillo/beta-catenin-like repeat family protein [Aphelenchus avenae]